MAQLIEKKIAPKLFPAGVAISKAYLRQADDPRTPDQLMGVIVESWEHSVGQGVQAKLGALASEGVFRASAAKPDFSKPGWASVADLFVNMKENGIDLAARDQTRGRGTQAPKNIVKQKATPPKATKG